MPQSLRPQLRFTALRKLDDGWKNAQTIHADRVLWNPSEGHKLDFKIMYDSTYIYFYADVTDSTVGTAEQEKAGDADYWLRNTVQIYLDLGNDKTSGAYDGNDVRFDVNARGYFFCHWVSAASFIKHAAVVTDTGYTVEAAIDVGLYPQFKAEKGTKIGFDIWACDSTDYAGRAGASSWTGEPDVYFNASLMGTVTLGDKPGDAPEYDGVIKGTYLPSLGATLTAGTNAKDKDVSVIVDGFKCNTQNVDTWQAEYTDDLGIWFSVDFGGKYDLKQVIFWEGGHWDDGGWFGSTPKLQIFKDGEWVDSGVSVSPSYPEDNRGAQGYTHEPYYFTLDDTITCSAIRIVGAKNSLAGHASVVEIEAYGYKEGETPVVTEPDDPVTPDDPTPDKPTGDVSSLLVLVSALSLAGTALIVSKKRHSK